MFAVLYLSEVWGNSITTNFPHTCAGWWLDGSHQQNHCLRDRLRDHPKTFGIGVGWSTTEDRGLNAGGHPHPPCVLAGCLTAASSRSRHSCAAQRVWWLPVLRYLSSSCCMPSWTSTRRACLEAGILRQLDRVYTGSRLRHEA